MANGFAATKKYTTASNDAADVFSLSDSTKSKAGTYIYDTAAAISSNSAWTDLQGLPPVASAMGAMGK